MKYLILIILFFSSTAFSEGYYLNGKIKDITATTNGLMIQMDNGIPTICNGTPYNWLLIKKEYSSITSLVLAMWVSNKKQGMVYVSGRENGTGYCLVSQFDPSENQ